MAPTTAYRADDEGWIRRIALAWLDVVGLLVVPCVPIARASAISGCPFIIVFLLVAGFYGVGLWNFTVAYSQEDYNLLGFLSGWSVLFFGWLLYVIGPVLALPGLLFWFFKAFGCGLDDYGGPPCDRFSEEPGRGPISIGCFLVVTLIALAARQSLLHRYGTKRLRDCSYHCLACLAPCCGVAEIAREARQQVQHDDADQELPAYTA